MCEQTEVNYLDGEVVWVKLGSCWWPGEVVGHEKLPPDLLPSFRKPPIAVVKFFQEDTYEYVKNVNSIFKYNCIRKDEFINKGLYMYRTKHGHMEKFPEDVIRAETAVGGDIEILTRDQYQEKKKESYAGLFGEPAKRTPGSAKKSKGGKAESPRITTPFRKLKDKVDYKVHILVQGPKSTPPLPPATCTPTSEIPHPESAATPSTSAEPQPTNKEEEESLKEIEEKSANTDNPAPAVTTPVSSSGAYSCHACPFTTSRLNVLILHNKTHSVSFTPYTPSPVRNKVSPKSTKSTPNSSKTPKVRKPRKEKSNKEPKKPAQNKKRAAEEQHNAESKKVKTDEEIKSSLLADWDDGDEESNDESSTIVMAGSPEVPETAVSPAVPTSAEISSLPFPGETPPLPVEKKSNTSPTIEKPESSTSDSKYEFCEDEEWHVEADAGRKIPRVKNPKRKEDTKSLSLDEDDVAREVAELLNKTTVPELPSAPEPLKVEENFPEPSIVKSPDKQEKSPEQSEKAPDPLPNKAIFKTKTFFRSRHSRSQDAIGKYVAEQLNAVERMDIADSEINGSEAVSSPEARESPPIEHVKVARLAPKIQLKKMKAEAAQLREKDKNNFEQFSDIYDLNRYADIMTANTPSPQPEILHTVKEDNMLEDKTTQEIRLPDRPLKDVLYPTQEIKPVNTDDGHRLKSVLNKPEISIASLDRERKDLEETPFTDVRNTVENEPIIEVSNTVENKPTVEVSNTVQHETETPHDITISIDARTEEMDVEVRDEITTAIVEGSSRLESTGNEITVTVNEMDEVTNEIDETTYESTSNDVAETINKMDVVTSDAETLNNMDVETRDAKLINKIDVETSEMDVTTDKLEEPVNEDVTNKMDEKNNKLDLRTDDVEIPLAGNKFVDTTSLHKTFEQPIQPYMNETTASAVDALLSVSREADRVTRVISDDLPEDLFEDDNKDIGTCNNMNGYNNISNEENVISELPHEKVAEQDKEKNELKNDFSNTEKSQDSISENILVEDSVATIEEQVIIDSIPETVIETPDSIIETPDTIIETPETVIETPETVIETSETVIETPETVIETPETVIETEPSESDLQIAETLLNLPSTAIQSKACNEIQVESHNLPALLEHNQEIDMHSAESIVVDEQLQDSIEVPSKPDKENHQSKSLLISNNDSLNVRFETELEKNENLTAAQSLVQMSETIDHKITLDHSLSNPVTTKDINEAGLLNVEQNNGIDSMKSVEQKVAMLSNDNTCETSTIMNTKMDTSSSKLLKILEEPCIPKISPSKPIVKKQVIIPGKEKILNFDVAKSTFKSDIPKQKIIIRRTATGRNVIKKVNDIGQPDKIILSRSRDPAQDRSVQTYTIQTSPDPPTDANTIVFQQKIRKLAKPPMKLQKLKPQNSLVNAKSEPKIINETNTDDAMFDINSMPIVLSEDLITPESIEKMPIVMSDGNILTPPKLVKTKPPETEKSAISPNASQNKPEVKTLLMNPVGEVNKAGTTPNILSKSSKLRAAKPMLVIDKTTGKQKIIMTKSEPTVKEVKPAPTLVSKPAATLVSKPATTLVSKSGPTLVSKPAATLVSKQSPQNSGKGEKFIILPSQSSPRPTRTQKIVIDPQTGKAHVLMTTGPETQIGATDNKPVSAKLVPPSTDVSAPGNTVMIITNAQGAQSRIVLTPEHEKMLFPKKQQANVSQLKTITHRISTTTGAGQKSLVTNVVATKPTQNIVATKTNFAAAKTQNVSQPKAPARIVPKQKNAIITSKGQLIVGGRVATPTQNIAPMPEIRPVPKRIMASEPKKLVQTIQKASSETLIFLQQKSGAVMQLTAAQFEHLQRTGQIVQKSAPAHDNKLVLQKKITIPANDSSHKPRARKMLTEAPMPLKKLKQEIVISPTPAPISPVPPMSPLSNTVPTVVPLVSNTVSVTTTSSYPEFENFEELLPSTAIVRQQDPIIPEVAQPEPIPPPPEPAPAPLSDGQLLAVPGEHFGGPPGSFYLCVEDSGTLTPIDNRPLVLDNNQLVPMAVEPSPALAAQPERRDILEAALANSDVFHADTTRDEAPDFRDLNANVSVHCRVSETSTTLNQPIMTPVEVPSNCDSEPAVPANLEDGLAVIGVTPHTVPTSLELPITVTDPRIAPKTTDPLSGTNYATTTLLPSPSTELTFGTVVESVDVPMGGPISMPLLTDDEPVGKSMPILTDDLAERTVSSVESTVDSPSSIEVRDSEMEDGGQWTRRLLTPGSDTSENSSEIPLQPALQFSVTEISRHS